MSEKGDLIELRNVKKDYYLGEIVVNALRGITLNIKQGSFVCVMGPSGCGKTTLLNQLGCIDYPTSGEVIISSTNVTNLNDHELTRFRMENIGFIFQTFSLIPVLSVYENIEYPLFLRKCSAKDRKNRVQKLLTELDLVQIKGHRPNEISGGQMQRVAIARALVMDPKFVLADEPTGNLDSKTSEKVIEFMHQMNREFHTTFIVATHDEMILNYANETYYIRDGLLR